MCIRDSCKPQQRKVHTVLYGRDAPASERGADCGVFRRDLEALSLIHISYSQKGKISNLKEMNETFNYLRANGIYNLEDLGSRVNEHSSTTESLKKTLDGQTARMKEIKQLYDSSAAFQNLKPVYDGLQKIKFEKPRACLLYTSRCV